jgi:hypothetical protein
LVLLSSNSPGAETGLNLVRIMDATESKTGRKRFRPSNALLPVKKSRKA